MEIDCFMVSPKPVSPILALGDKYLVKHNSWGDGDSCTDHKPLPRHPMGQKPTFNMSIEGQGYFTTVSENIL
jgi:hypothetical protein